MRSALAMCALVIATFTAGLAAPAAALDRLVDESGVPCVSGGLPIHLTISDAVATAAPGETIGVCAGTYSESVLVFTDGLVLQALGLVKLVGPGTDGFGFAVVGSGVTIQGFDISGFTEVQDCGIAAFGSGEDIRNNRVHDNDFGICVVFTESTRIRNNVIENHAGDGISTFFADSMLASGNTVRNNSGFGMWLEACDYGGAAPTNIDHNSVTGNGGDGIYAPDCPATIQNNTVRNNALAGPEFHGIHVFDTLNAVVTKNSVQSSNVGIFMEEVSGGTVSFNSVGFNAVGIDVVGSDGVTFTRNNVTRSTVVDCRVDDETLHTFTANACGSEEPVGAWD